MKRNYLIIVSILLSLFIFSCAPVLRKDIMDAAIRDFSFPEIKQNPEMYKGKLIVLGGIIINTKLTAEGSLIESLYAPVDSRGYLRGVGTTHIRFLALFPKESGFLDPMIFKRGREITLAGEFIGIREGKIDDMEYGYPFFLIKELYLWEESKIYYVPYYEPYPYWWDRPYWWGDRLRFGIEIDILRSWDRPYWWRDRPYWWWRYHAPPPYWW